MIKAPALTFMNATNDSSNCAEVLHKKKFLNFFAKSTRKLSMLEPHFDKVAGLKPSILLKARLRYRCFQRIFKYL